MNAPDTVVLIHGLWMTPLAWRDWAVRLEDRGFRVLTPAWPRMNHSADELRANPSLVAGLGIAEVAEFHARLIADLDRPPIIMGHSLGGLIVEQMLGRGLGAAGVAINPGPSKGVYGVPLDQLRTVLPVMRNPLNYGKAVSLTAQQFHFAFAGVLHFDDARRAWETYHVPAPGRPVFQVAFANFTPRAATTVDYHKPDRPPLLMVASSADRMAPPSVVSENVLRYQSGIVDYREYADHSHFIIGEPGWQTVLDESLQWALDRSRVSSRQ